MAIREILQLGHPVLRKKCRIVRSFDTPDLHSLITDLRDTLYDFKNHNGFGRGIAAPQIGIAKRVIFLSVDEPLALVNPAIVRSGARLFSLWDDCFSFPNLLVKVKRKYRIEVRYQTVKGEKCMLKAEGRLSELLQHEIDHLNGILAIDRAISPRHIAFRSEYEKWSKLKSRHKSP